MLTSDRSPVDLFRCLGSEAGLVGFVDLSASSPHGENQRMLENLEKLQLTDMREFQFKTLEEDASDFRGRRRGSLERASRGAADVGEGGWGVWVLEGGSRSGSEPGKILYKFDLVRTTVMKLNKGRLQ